MNTQVFSGITALTAFNRNANGVNGFRCRYKGVNGVLLVGIKALTAFNRKNSSGKNGGRVVSAAVPEILGQVLIGQLVYRKKP